MIKTLKRMMADWRNLVESKKLKLLLYEESL